MIHPKRHPAQARPTSARKTRRIRFEGLESRVAMAVDCDVTCELTNEQLTIVGSTNDDVIEVRYDAETRSVRILGDGQLVGVYAADTISSLVVQGLDGNDQLCLDSNLPVACYVDGGEGEDQLRLSNVLLSGSTSSNSHSHGGNSTGAIFERDIESVTADPVGSLNEFNGVAEGEANGPVNSTVPLAMLLSNTIGNTHLDHSASVIGSAVDQHGAGHASSGSSALGRAVTVSTSEGHDAHAVSLLLAANLVVDSSDSFETASSESSGGDASHHGTSTMKAASNEIAKKWCTTTPLANRLVTTLEGKPTCFCKDPVTGEESSAGDLANGDGDAVINACSPRLSAWDAILADLDAAHICSDKSTDELVASMTNAFARERRRSTASGERTSEREETAEASTSYLEWTGWGLVAVGIYLAPLLLKRTDTDADREARERADAERHAFELLTM